MFKKIMSCLMAGAIVVSSGILSVSAEDNLKNYSGNEKIVFDYWNSINTGDWNNWVSFYPIESQKMYSEFIFNQKNIKDNAGILTVKKVNVLSINQVDNSYAPKYPEYVQYYKSCENFLCYRVCVDMQVNEETDYFKNGINYKLVLVLKKGDRWYVGAECGCPSELIPQTRGIGTGFIDGDISNPPNSIKIRQGYKNSDGDLVGSGQALDVYFNDFIKNTVSGEIGNLNYNMEAIKANCLAEKMFGWWCHLGHYRDTYGCDLLANYDVAYAFDRYYYPQAVVTAANQISDSYILSNNGRFFSTNVNGYSSFDYRSSGVLVQSGSNRLAKNGYSCNQIIHYYFDNSTFNHPNVGIVTIG